MSTSRVSIIRTEPSDEYASTLMGTRLVIIAVVAIGQLLMTMKTGDGSQQGGALFSFLHFG